MYAEKTTRARGQTGMTLPELMVAITISTFIVALFGEGYVVLARHFKSEEHLSTCQLELSDTYLALERDLKDAGNDPRRAGLFSDASPPIEIVPPGESLAGGLRIRTDMTGSSGAPDGDLADADEVVVYAIDADQHLLLRWASNGTGGLVATTLLRHVEGFAPTLLDSAGNAASGNAVSRVHLEISAGMSSDPRPGAPVRQYAFDIVRRN